MSTQREELSVHAAGKLLARTTARKAMRSVVLTLALTGMIGTAAGGCSGPAQKRAAPAQHDRPPVSYYLALGDSLSQGVQPDASGASVRTAHGYPDQLYAALHRRQPGLRLVKLGCAGETTVTMIHGGICSYPGGSQLAATVRFIRPNQARVALITLDIGANDPDSCITDFSIVKLPSCAGRSVSQAATNLTTILATLRQADAHARIIAMNYYLPALAEWRNGLAGQILARLGEVAVTGYNTLLGGIYQRFGVRVADVSGAFHTADFSPQVTLPGLGRLPRNVAAICQWTWECAPPPRGPNQHPDQAGYQVIAHAFLLAGAGQPARGSTGSPGSRPGV
jgi:lysophospholipase L1-like esterase